MADEHLTKKQKAELEAKRLREQEDIRRVRLPRNNQVLGVLEQRLGGSRCRIRCFDGKVRVCRIPGRLKRSLWVREGNIVLIEPWEFSGDEKGDIIFKYKPNQVHVLRQKGLLKEIDDFDDDF
ncbi:translation initiation factor eIF-1A [Candidatus Woesearchaeota archaeon]|nr:MAG: translation initiation factor eIF-1A [Candidatus Woesearchaeota archaeon]